MSSQVAPNSAVVVDTQNERTVGRVNTRDDSIPFVENIEQPIYDAKAKLSSIKHFFALTFIIDSMIVLISIFFMNYVKRGHFYLESSYIYLSILFIGFWLIVSGYFKKFNPKSYLSYRKGMSVIFQSSIAILYFLAITLVAIDYYNFSRIQMLGTCFLFFIFEATVFTVYYWSIGKRQFSFPIKRQIIDEAVQYFSMKRVIVDFVGLTISFLLLTYLKKGSLHYSFEYEEILLGLYGSWFFMGLATRKFEKRGYKNIYYAVSPFIKAFLLMVSTMAILIFTFNLYYISRLQIFGSFILLLILETGYMALNYIWGTNLDLNGDINSVEKAKALFDEKQSIRSQKADLPKKNVLLPVISKLEHDYLFEDKELFYFVNKHIDLSTIDVTDAMMINSHNQFNVDTIENNSKLMFFNLHKINDFRYINRYFLEVHKKIYNGGYFIGQAHTIATHRSWFKEKFPPYLTKILYPIDFLYRRIFPKLPVIKKLYFFFTKGENRILSKAEILGRLYFCGFKVLATTEIKNRFYFVAQCVKDPSIDKNPSYGPIIKLKRVGYGGNIIYIRKLRTMHPYSEYLQDYVYEQNKLQANGKFQNDFRLTEWGKVLRKMWIDELPQLINFWRGDVSIVGVRALSQHYFDLYPKDLQKLRIQNKPGLIPPYYADMPVSFEEIIESEKKYLSRKMDKRFLTDVQYFFKAVYNIIFKRARSR